MTEQELRAQIAAEIASKFGMIASTKLVADFVRTGPTKKGNDQ